MTYQPSSSGSQALAPLQVRLVGVRWAAEGTCLLDFAGAEGGLLPDASAGSHIDITLPNGIVRQYSLVSTGEDLQTYTVGVKRDADSRGGSAYIHEKLRVGTLLSVSPPRCNFELNESARHTVLIAGGIGITPVFAMVQRLNEIGASWTLHYACRSRSEAPFLMELSKLRQVKYHFDDESDGELLDIEKIVRSAPANSHFYCCGPAPMLRAFENSCASIQADMVHVEYFSPKSEVNQEGGFAVTLARSGLTIQVPPGKTIIEVVRDAGVDVPSSCEVGICGTCETRVISGIPDHRDSLLSESEKESSATMMICCSGSKSPELVLDL